MNLALQHQHKCFVCFVSGPQLDFHEIYLFFEPHVNDTLLIHSTCVCIANLVMSARSHSKHIILSYSWKVHAIGEDEDL